MSMRFGAYYKSDSPTAMRQLGYVFYDATAEEYRGVLALWCAAYGEGYGCQTIDGSEDLLGELWRCRYRHSEESEPLKAAIKIYKTGEGQMYSAGPMYTTVQEFCARAIQHLFRLSAVGFRAEIDSQDVRAFWLQATIPDWTNNQVWQYRVNLIGKEGDAGKNGSFLGSCFVACFA